MVETDCAIGPVSTRAGDHTFGLVQINNVDSVDIGASQAGGGGTLAGGAVDVAVLASRASVDGVLAVGTGRDAIGGGVGEIVVSCGRCGCVRLAGVALFSAIAEA